MSTQKSSNQGFLETCIGVIFNPVPTMQTIVRRTTHRLGAHRHRCNSHRAGHNRRGIARPGRLRQRRLGAGSPSRVLHRRRPRPGYLTSVAFFTAICWITSRILGGKGSYGGLFAGFGFAYLPAILTVPVTFMALQLDSFAQGLSGFIGFGIAVWTIVLSVFAVQANNNFSTGRAIAAVFLPLASLLRSSSCPIRLHSDNDPDRPQLRLRFMTMPLSCLSVHSAVNLLSPSRLSVSSVLSVANLLPPTPLSAPSAPSAVNPLTPENRPRLTHRRGNPCGCPSSAQTRCRDWSESAQSPTPLSAPSAPSAVNPPTHENRPRLTHRRGNPCGCPSSAQTRFSYLYLALSKAMTIPAKSLPRTRYGGWDEGSQPPSASSAPSAVNPLTPSPVVGEGWGEGKQPLSAPSAVNPPLPPSPIVGKGKRPPC